MSFAPECIAALQKAEKIVFFSGAGVSAESGVPTFRDDLTGLWAQYDPMELATPEAFERQPELVWGWYEWRRQRVRQAQPNAAHHTLAQWQQNDAAEVICMTQNVDDLHERAGCTQVLHLHGSLFDSFCVACAIAAESVPLSQNVAESGAPIEPPRCVHCQERIRPGVVWFGEALDGQILEQAFEQAADCDVCVVIGTSGVVQPAASIPLVAQESGARVLQINPQATPIDALADWNVRAPAARVLPKLYEQYLSG